MTFSRYSQKFLDREAPLLSFTIFSSAVIADLAIGSLALPYFESAHLLQRDKYSRAVCSLIWPELIVVSVGIKLGDEAYTFLKGERAH
jgi:hypothetical protein